MAMTPPTTLGTRRRPRRASLLAALAATVLAFSLITEGGAVSASAATPPASQYLQGTWCHLSNGWGGDFFCQGDYYSYWEQMPNGYWEVFVVGTNSQVWTRWNSSSGLSSWVSLGGQCLLYVAMAGSNGWSWTIECTAQNGGQTWYDTRQTNGHWTGWHL